MPQWTANYINDPENDFVLTIEILCDDEEISVIKYKGSELKYILFSRDKDIAIPFNWLLELMNEASRQPIINKENN